jgi:hypothetical protein
MPNYSARFSLTILVSLCVWQKWVRGFASLRLRSAEGADVVRKPRKLKPPELWSSDAIVVVTRSRVRPAISVT